MVQYFSAGGHILKLLAHPDNIELLKQFTRQSCETLSRIYGIEIVTNSLIPKTFREFKLPDGRLFRCDHPLPEGLVVFKTRFVDYGWDDLGYLIYAGIIEIVEKPAFFIMNESTMKQTLRTETLAELVSFDTRL